MKLNNPFTLTFGKEPVQLIRRNVQSEEVSNAFLNEPRTQQVFMITGIRGSGKTVFMTETSRFISEQEDWIVLELNPEKDLLTNLAAKLASENELAHIFQAAAINLSFFGFGLTVNGVPPITDIEFALQKMLTSLKKKGKHLLVTIDEVTNTPQMRIFAAAFQIFVRQNLPICLLMTGLYENINALQNEESLTFLYRAPKIELGPLNIGTIAEDYRKVFDLDEKASLEMAKATKGYSFAFQVLGYFRWEHPADQKIAWTKSREYLDEYAYSKIWMELSKKDRMVLHAIAQTKQGKISEIREILGMTNNEFSPYRQRLIKKGIISGEERGYVRFLLPFFDQFVLANYEI